MRLYLFEDSVARDFEPFALTRPLGEVLYGCLLQRERAERWLGTPCRGSLAGAALQGFVEPGAPPVVDAGSIGADDTRVLLTSRFVPEGKAPDPLRRAVEEAEGATLRSGGRTVGWVLPPGRDTPDDGALLEPDDGEAVGGEIELAGELLETPWGLVAGNAGRITRDVELLHPRDDAFLPHGVERRGDGAVSLGDGLEIEPGVILDVRDGPIHLGDGVVVRSSARLEGPFHAGPGTVLLGGSYTGTSIGPVCKVRGEVEASVILGYSNKAHDGYLGHALVGRWVNLGALTTNSDLKNNYSPVRVTTSRGEHDTGLLKVGCFLGDHVKTGIGALLNTGTVVGAGSNLFGSRMPPKYVPPFSWGAGADLSEFRLDRFLETARAVMDRREIELDGDLEALLRRAWDATRDERRAG